MPVVAPQPMISISWPVQHWEETSLAFPVPEGQFETKGPDQSEGQMETSSEICPAKVGTSALALTGHLAGATGPRKEDIQRHP